MKKGLKTLLVLLMLMVVCLTACGGSDKEQGTTGGNTEQAGVNDTAQNDTGSTENSEEEFDYTSDPNYTGNENLLSGLYTLSDDAVGKRPVAIMINNLPAALPQYGIGSADIIFEVTVEGGLSRMMAIYGDYTQIPKVCSVRSCRKYFPELSEGFDAIYVCSGMGTDVRAYINTLNLTLYDGTYNTGNLFGRDQDRRAAGYSMEHTMYFDGTGLVNSIESSGKRIDIESDKTDAAFTFVALGKTVVPDGDACSAVTVDFGAVTATLRYDAETNTYLKEINGNAQLDQSTGEQLSFTNVIIMETKVGADSNGKDRTINWKGGDDSVAYYISNGYVQQIHYKKDSIESRLMFYDADGNEIELNRGKTYIAINFTGRTTLE